MTFDSDTASALVIGACLPNGENPFLGTLDDVRLYDEILSVEQIRAVRAPAEVIHWIRAAYWDQHYPTSWVHGTDVRDALASAGYTILNAQELAGWMNDRIADGQASVVVFCQDIAPDTVFEQASTSCTLRQYLDAGGKVLWYGDIPFYYQGHDDGSRSAFDMAGSMAVLGLNAAGGTWDITRPVALTYEGRSWGLTRTWSSSRPALRGNHRVLAYDSKGQAAAWVRHYVPGDTYAGFVRFFDTGGSPCVEDTLHLAEHPNVQSIRSEGLQAYYAFEGDVSDSAGNHHGTVVGRIRYSPGMIGQALDLNGEGHYIDCGNAATLSPTSEISVAVWIKAHTIPTDWTGIVTKGDTAWGLYTWRNDPRICFAVTESDYVIAASRLPANQWYHVCATYDGSAIRIYIDGVESGAEPCNAGIATNSKSVWIGGYSGHFGHEWDGLIDELCIYDRVLDPAEVVLLATP